MLLAFILPLNKSLTDCPYNFFSSAGIVFIRISTFSLLMPFIFLFPIFLASFSINLFLISLSNILNLLVVSCAIMTLCSVACLSSCILDVSACSANCVAVCSALVANVVLSCCACFNCSFIFFVSCCDCFNCSFIIFVSCCVSLSFFISSFLFLLATDISSFLFFDSVFFAVSSFLFALIT